MRLSGIEQPRESGDGPGPKRFHHLIKRAVMRCADDLVVLFARVVAHDPAARVCFGRTPEGRPRLNRGRGEAGAGAMFECLKSIGTILSWSGQYNPSAKTRDPATRARGRCLILRARTWNSLSCAVIACDFLDRQKIPIHEISTYYIRSASECCFCAPQSINLRGVCANRA